jgi:hypothetical protein
MAPPVALKAEFIQMEFSAEATVILAAVDKYNITVESLQYMDDKDAMRIITPVRRNDRRANPGRWSINPSNL